MNTDDFRAALTRDGYRDIGIRELTPNFHADEHSHPFGVRALVVDGQLTLGVDGAATTYRAGDVFELDTDCPHVEDAGADGVKFVYGRLHDGG